MCPSYLDGDHAHDLGVPERRPSAEHAVIPVCWHGCAVFKVREEGARPVWALGLSKLNSMERTSSRSAPPGPVDVSVAAPAGRREAGRHLAKPARYAPAA